MKSIHQYTYDVDHPNPNPKLTPDYPFSPTLKKKFKKNS